MWQIKVFRMPSLEKLSQQKIYDDHSIFVSLTKSTYISLVITCRIATVGINCQAAAENIIGWAL